MWSKNAMQLKCDCLLQKLRLKCTADKRRLGSLQVCSSNAFLLAIAQSKRIFFAIVQPKRIFFAIAQPKRIFFAIWQPKRIFLEEKCDWQSQSHFFAQKMRRARTNAFFRKKNAPRADKCIFQSHFCNLRSKTLSQRIFKTHFKCDLRRQTHFKCDLSIKSYFFCAMEEW